MAITANDRMIENTDRINFMKTKNTMQGQSLLHSPMLFAAESDQDPLHTMECFFPWKRLPLELARKIFLYLTYPELAQASLV